MNPGRRKPSHWRSRYRSKDTSLGKSGRRRWASELKAAADRGEPDDGSKYYEHWVAALERLVTEKRLTDRQTLRERKDAWAEAYRHTPHGKPVELAANVHMSEN